MWVGHTIFNSILHGILAFMNVKTVLIGHVMFSDFRKSDHRIHVRTNLFCDQIS